MNMTEPKWVAVAKSYLGLKEIVGPKHNPTIVKWLVNLRAWWTDDETPWCGVAMAEWMRQCELEYPKAYYRASSWATWGIGAVDRYNYIPYGAIGVWSRKGGGHVGIIVGVRKDGWHMVLGGNQGNAVSIVALDPKRLVTARVPAKTDFRARRLPIYQGPTEVSHDEA
jgi:uncharacterized protein (TIGR02594 family)